MKRGMPLFLLLLTLITHVAFAQEPQGLPLIDRALRAKLKSVYALGLGAGNRPGIFAKFGDSITRSPSFLIDIGCGVAVLGENSELNNTIEFFRQSRFPSSFSMGWCNDSNSFTRDSHAAFGGWTADDPLKKFSNPIRECPSPHDTPLRCELHLLKPSIALIMFGTNDVDENNPSNFRKKLTKIAQEVQILGVIPVLSTIPPRQDRVVIAERVELYNQIIREIASTLQVPLWDYSLALQARTMKNHGMSSDGIHPNVYKDAQPAVFIEEALRFGFNQRNFTALEVLKKIRAQIQKNGPADHASTPNFVLYASNKIPKVQPGTSIRFKIEIARVNHQDSIRLDLKGQPGGVTATFKKNPDQTEATMTLKVGPGVVPGEHRITIQGISGTLIRSTTMALIVTL